MRALKLILAALVLLGAPMAAAQTVKLSPKEGDYIAKDFVFKTGETLAELRLHYTTLERPIAMRAARSTTPC